MRVQAPADDAGALNDGRAATRTVWRVREVAICVGLTALAFFQSPGLIVADSKIDMALNPIGWLSRSVHLWDPAGSFGQLQNQAYGYLWPMGPFFAGGFALGIPAWAVQRLWWALIMCVAFTGVVRLASRLGVGTPTSRLIAGIAFALSPRILTELGALSVEAWPSAVAPWVLVPLIGLVKGASIRRSVALSALAVACAGGVNATAVFAVVPLAAVWLLTLTPASRRFAALAAWCLAVLAATTWWLVPLLILGRYSPPFLDYIETASATTSVTDSVTALRGASHWVAFLRDAYGPLLPAGWRIAFNPVIAGGTIVIAAIGVAGLSRRGMPHRRFLVAGLALGLALVGLGHVSDLPGTFAGAQHDFLDGIGAPLRNVHKFDVLIRLPLALGVTHLLGILGRVGAVRRKGLRYAPVPSALVGASAIVAIVAVAAPGLSGGLAAAQGFRAVPKYWQSAADWLNANADKGKVLVVPGARFPNYTWGNTLDEMTQPLLTGPSAVRSAIPFAQPGTIRMMDAIESVLANGDGSAGLADYLARAGVKYLLVRSDLDYGRSGTTQPVLVRQALSRSPGLSLVTGFGPMVGGNNYGGVFYDHGLGIQVRSLEIFEVQRPVAQVVAYQASDATTVVGGPESLLALAGAGALPDGPAVLAGDLGNRPVTGPVAITDGLRRRDVSFGSGRDNTSATLTTEEAEGSRDYLPSWGAEESTTVAYRGIASVVASSTRAEAASAGGSRPANQPFAAFDGDPQTSWRPAPGVRQPGQWVEVTLAKPTPVSQIMVRFDGLSGALPTKITVDTGADRSTVESFAGSVTINLPGINAIRTVRLTIDEVLPSRVGGTFGIAEVEIPGVVPERTLVVPAPPANGPAATVVLTAAPSVPACVFVDEVPRCNSGIARESEDGTTIDRTLTLTTPATYQPSIWARARPGLELNALLDLQATRRDPLGTPSVVSSSTAVVEPAGRAGAVFDGDPRTVWSPAPTDTTPTLQFTWAAPRTITGLQLSLASQTAATRVGAVRIVADGTVLTRFLSDGAVQFDPPLQTRNLAIFPLETPTARSYNPYTTGYESLPIAIGEITFLPAEAAPMPDLEERLTLPCGSGPTLRVGSAEVKTRLSPTIRDLVERRETQAQPCTADALPVGAGTVVAVASSSALASPTRLVLTPRVADRAAAVATSVRIDAWAATERRVTVAPHAEAVILAVRENTNTGWQATAGDRVLEPIVVDGWQQGWLVPADVAGEITLRFQPDTLYRGGLLAGAALILALLVLAVVPVRRLGMHASWVRALGVEGRVAPFVIGGGALIVVGGLVGAVIVAMALAVVAYRGVGPRHSRGKMSHTVEMLLPASLLIVGGWLSLTVDTPHREVWPQVAGILAVGAVWFSVSISIGRRRSRPEPPTQALGRLLNDVKAQRRQAEPTDHGHGEYEHRLATPHGTAQHGGQGVDHYDVPEEQSERDGAHPPQPRMAQGPVE